MPGELIPVQVVARSRQEKVEWHGDGLRVQVCAPPVQGRANQAVRRAVARVLGCPPSAVEIARGQHSRRKWLRIAGWSPGRVRQSLQGS